MTRDGEPVTTAQVTTPFHFCTSGATVFAPGVNLTDFSATYNSVFTPDQSGEVVFDIYAYGSGRLRINGEEVRGFSNQHGGQKSAYTLQVYLKKNDDVEGPSKALRAFKRVHIPAGKTVDVEFDLGDKELVWWNPQSNTMCVSEGSYELMVGGSSQTAGLLRRSFVIQP